MTNLNIIPKPRTSSGTGTSLLGSLAGAGLSKLFGPAVGQIAGKGISGIASALKSNTATSPSYTSSYSSPYTAPTSQYLAPPTLDTSYPEVPQITYDEALSRAKAYFEPQYNSAVLSQNQLAADQQKRLTQALAARGYASARGGHRQTGEGDISQSHAAALDNLKNQYDSQIGRYAGELYTGGTNDAYQQLTALLNDRNARNQAALQQYGMDLNAGLQREQMQANTQSNYYNALWNLAMMLADAGEE